MLLTKVSQIRNSFFFILFTVFLSFHFSPPGAQAGLGDTLTLPDLTQLEGSTLESLESGDLLRRLFRVTADLSIEPPLSSQAVRLRGEIKDLKELYLQDHRARQSEVQKYDDFPIIFHSIKLRAREATLSYREDEVKKYVSSVDPHVRINEIPKENLDKLHKKYKNEDQLVSKIQKKLNHWISKNSCSVSESRVELRRQSKDLFLISTHGNGILDHSIHRLLVDSEQLHKSGTDILSGSASGDIFYKQKNEFSVRIDELSHLDVYLKAFQRLRDQLHELLLPLVITSEDEDPSVIEGGLLNFGELFTAFSINLGNHFFRDPIGKILGKSLSIELSAGNYRLNLGFQDLKKIEPYLCQVIRTKRWVESVFGPDSYFNGTAAQVMSEEELDPLSMMKLHEVNELNNISKILQQESYSDEEYYRIKGLIQAETQIEGVSRESSDILVELLKHRAGVSLRSLDSHRFVPSPDQIRKLYPHGELADFRGKIPLKNIQDLIQSLYLSPNVQELFGHRPFIPKLLKDFKKQLVVKLNDYHKLEATGFYGRQMVDKALDYLEALVAKIVYHEQSGVTLESVGQAFDQLAGLLGSDLVNGCSAGLAGRLSQLLSSLVFSSGSEVKDFIEQQKYQAYQAAIAHVLRKNSESSMAARKISQAYRAIAGFAIFGEESIHCLADFEEDDNILKSLKRFSTQFNSVKLYSMTQKYLVTQFLGIKKDSNDFEMYRFLEGLGFGSSREDLDQRYRTNGQRANPWDFSSFQMDLPKRLIQFLISQGILFPHAYDSSDSVYYRGFDGGIEFQI